MLHNTFSMVWRWPLWQKSYRCLWTMKQDNSVHKTSHSTVSHISAYEQGSACWIPILKVFSIICVHSIISQTTVAQENQAISFLMVPLGTAVSCLWGSICQSTRVAIKRMSGQRKSAAVCNLCVWFALRTHIKSLWFRKCCIGGSSAVSAPAMNKIKGEIGYFWKGGRLSFLCFKMTWLWVHWWIYLRIWI